MLTVADVLALPVVRQGLPEVVGGADYLGNEVRWVHVLDVEDASGLLKGGEFVLCNGFGLGQEARTQRSFVRELSEQRAAALAVELGILFRQALPEPLVDEARRAGLPLIALHRKTRFVEVTETVHQQLLGAEFAQLRAVDELSRRLTKILMGGGEVPAVLAELARTLGNPVILEDAAGRLVDWSSHRAAEDVVLRAWQDLLAAERRDGEIPRGAREAPVQLVHGTWGRLLALELDGPLDEHAADAVERGAEAVSLRLVSRRREDELSARSRGAFLDALATRQLDESRAAQRARALGFERTSERLVPIAVTARGDLPDDDPWAAAAAGARTALARGGYRGVIGPVGSLLLGIIADTTPGSADHRGQIAQALHAGLVDDGLGSDQVALVFAAPADSWTAAAAGLERCVRHASVAAHRPPAAWHDAARVTLDEVFDELGSAATLAAFIDERLGPVLDPDGTDKRRAQMLHTLEVYLRHGARKTSAAQELNLERQSLYHRLQRLSDVLGVDWSDGDAVFELHLAVRAQRALEQSDRRG